MRIDADKSKWTAASRRSPLTSGYYEDEEYQCRKCRRKAVYSAQEQKRDAEERKLYVWTRRILCPECHRAKLRIDARLKTYEVRWPAKKKELHNLANFASEWIQLLEEAGAYWAKAPFGMVKTLRPIAELGRKRRSSGRKTG
ncbi:MAG: hypothetical protein HZB91_03200 [Elusimicrobia bacterium]|nr:hypothetical protein [Elusimicrobiota bacterium]